MNAHVEHVEHLLITFWWVSCVAATRKWWLRCSTHKDAFIINDFLRYPHFSEYDESKLYVSNKYLNFFLRNTTFAKLIRSVFTTVKLQFGLSQKNVFDRFIMAPSFIIWEHKMQLVWPAKGQLISKGNFSAFNSPKKRTLLHSKWV